MEVFPEKRIRNRALLTAASSVLLSIPFIITGKGLIIFLPLLAGAGILYFFIYLQKFSRRERIAKKGLAENIRRVLMDKVSFYKNLSTADKSVYESNIAIFLSEHSIDGVDGIEITDEVKALVAASAVRLTFRRPGWEYYNFGEILIYPGGFSPEGNYSTKSQSGFTAAGMVHSQGGVILSLPHLLNSFAHENDGFNVGYHEFAHVLDGRRPDGTPDELNLGSYRPWAQAMQFEFEKVHSHRSVLRDYAGTNPAEFFACSVEYFFEKPEKMKARAPEVYRQLSTFFDQDPAAGK
ncbi:MAG: zinc-dependent peptidase [Candidatus Sabulitectum sp.]|nr:zinc-dependent peptidase [Candidatus Sabulitectum sp.]